jgi:hypothetical protein
MDWDRMDSNDQRIRLRGIEQELVPLVRVHSPGPDPDGWALARLNEATRSGPVLVVAREGLGLTQLDERLAGCDLVTEGPPERLLICR